MSTTAPGWIRGVPNTLSGLRLVLACAFPCLPAVGRLPAVFAAGGSDWLDGLIARRYGVQSTFGGLLDAAADKAFVLSALGTLAVAGLLEVWQLPVLLVRDLVVFCTTLYFVVRRNWVAFGGMSARWWGKLTTILTFALLVAVLAPAPDVVRGSLFVLAAAASLVAGVDYLMRFVRALRTTTRTE